jgi:uncharacterized membrane protein (DUF485 family)
MSVPSESMGRENSGTPGMTADDDSLRSLVAAKARFLAPMIVIYMAAYIGLTALAGFAKGFMALKVLGSLNVGFVLIALNYGLSWVLALVYVHVADTIFDPMVRQAVAGMTSHRGRR